MPFAEQMLVYMGSIVLVKFNDKIVNTRPTYDVLYLM